MVVVETEFVRSNPNEEWEKQQENANEVDPAQANLSPHGQQREEAEKVKNNPPGAPPIYGPSEIGNQKGGSQFPDRSQPRGDR